MTGIDQKIPGSTDAFVFPVNCISFFAGQHGCLCCRTLIHVMRLKSPEYMHQCVAFNGEVAEEVATIILREMQTDHLVFRKKNRKTETGSE